MADLGQAQVGHEGVRALKSTPKLTRINGDDNLKVIWKNMGNNHTYPLIWGQEFTVASGTVETVLVASGTKYHGFDFLTYANVQVTPCYDSGLFYVTKDTSDGQIKLTTTNSGADDGSSKVDVKFMLGVDPTIPGIYCSTWDKHNIRANYP